MVEQEESPIVPGSPMPEKLPVGAGSTMENVGGYMIVISVIFGLISAYLFGRVVNVETSIFGSSTNQTWSALNLALVAAATSWSVALSYGIYRIGTILRWAEAIGKKNQVIEG